MTPPSPVVAAVPELAFRTDVAHELRLTSYLYEQVIGELPSVVRASAGGLTLFGAPGERLALAIPVRWGATMAAAPRSDGLVDVRSGMRIGSSVTRPVGSAPVGSAPRGNWAGMPGWALPAHALVAEAALLSASGLAASGSAASGSAASGSAASGSAASGSAASGSLAERAPGGMTMVVGTNLPDGIGLQVEAALTSAVASSVEDVLGVRVPLARRAALADVAAQVASLSCPDGHAVLVDRESLSAKLVPLDLASAGLRLLLIDLGRPPLAAPTTGVLPAASEPDGGVPDLVAAATAAAEAGDLRSLGPLLTHTRPTGCRGGKAAGREAAERGAAGSEAADRGADVGEADVGVVATAAGDAGALGVGLLPGGCLAALVPIDEIGAVRSAVVAAWPGARPPRILSALASRGGREITDLPPG